jgi:hypothetical protein
MVSQNIMHDRRLKLFDRGLLVTLMSLPDNWNFTIKGLASILCDGRDAVSAGLKRLEELGYLVKEQLREDGKFSDICLRINVEPTRPMSEKPVTEKPLPGKPSPENPVTVNPVPDIPAQYINNKSNINRSNNKISPISDGKEKKYGAGRKRQDNSNGSGRAQWSKDEIDLYGL